DLAGDRVGDDGLEAVAHLDPELPVLHEQNQEQPVVEALLAEPPLLEELVGDVLEALALERRENRDRHLGARASLTLGELRLEALPVGGRQKPGVVVHAGARRRGQDEGGGEDEREQRPRTSLWGPSPRPAPPRRTPSAGSRRSPPRASRGRGGRACCSRGPPRCTCG